ncbi:hypothetical protein [Campylobacter showae]|uniref:hypothetical protein n=1 Tax=Campylobacter showae TaxID=204 RepID=UPI0012FE28CA|nr:hypothetical protein [Campylobacter showae]
MNCALLAALKESASTRRSVAEAKELPFVPTFLFFLGGGRGFTSPAARNCEQTYLRSVAPSSPVCLQLLAQRRRKPHQPHCT